MLYRLRKVGGGFVDAMLYKSRDSVERLLEDTESPEDFEVEEIPYHIKSGVSIVKAIRTLSERTFEYENGRLRTIDLDDILEDDDMRRL